MTTTEPTATLTGWSLSVAIAERRGWRDLQLEGDWSAGIPPGESVHHLIPAYHESLDACERDLFPMLEQAGWYPTLTRCLVRDPWRATLTREDRSLVAGVGDRPATALCRAFLAAMGECAEVPEPPRVRCTVCGQRTTALSPGSGCTRRTRTGRMCPGRMKAGP